MLLQVFTVSSLCPMLCLINLTCLKCDKLPWAYSEDKHVFVTFILPLSQRWLCSVPVWLCEATTLLLEVPTAVSAVGVLARPLARLVVDALGVSDGGSETEWGHTESYWSAEEVGVGFKFLKKLQTLIFFIVSSQTYWLQHIFCLFHSFTTCLATSWWAACLHMHARIQWSLSYAELLVILFCWYMCWSLSYCWFNFCLLFIFPGRIFWLFKLSDDALFPQARCRMAVCRSDSVYTQCYHIINPQASRKWKKQLAKILCVQEYIMYLEKELKYNNIFI